MGDKLVIGVPLDKGLRTDRKAFAIDDNSFPTLTNAYQWRGRALRKRGTRYVNRLQRIIGTTAASTGNFTYTINPHPIQPGISVFMIGTTIFVDWDINPADDPVVLTTNSLLASATLNRTTGVLTILGGTTNPLTNVIYFPALPVMGFEDFVISTQAYSGSISFDTTYAYQVSTSSPYTPTDISFYKNPGSATYTNYVAKTTPTPLWWNGQNYQQIWSTNYQGSFWATNGITIPFSTTNIGMQFAPTSTISAISITSNTTIQMTITPSPLVIGDFVFLNEWSDSTTAANASAINFQTGYVTAASNPGGANTITITFPNAMLPYNAGMPDTIRPGIVQYLTNSSNTAQDCLRWYDGTGWVNFCPPLSQGPYTIEDSPQAVYYLIGARLIVPFKNRLLFFGAVIQPSAGSATPIYLQDTVVYSLDGTPYYTASFIPVAGNILNTGTAFYPVLVPINQTAFPMAYWEDQFGFGGNQPAGIDQPISTVSPNEDALIVGFNNSIQTRFIFTGNDIQPFQFYIINAELGSTSTFSAITMDEGVITRGLRGFIITAQTSCSRFDLEILDQVFQVSNMNNGAERFTAQRDFINEWIYFTYPSNQFSPVFPTQTLQYNYRDQSWAIFNETYTTYGQFKPLTGYTWETIGNIYPTWADWNVPWNAGASTPLQPQIVGGNQQGYLIQRGVGTGESPSLYVQDVTSFTITSVNHCLNTGDYISISGAQGDVGAIINNIPFKITVASNNTFTIFNPNVLFITGSYLGGGQITRYYIPEIYSKQFPTSWGLGRKTRIGVQQYLFTKTDAAQITLLIFLSTDTNDPYNNGPLVPNQEAITSGLIYSNVLYTCPESTNLGLTPANTNLLQLNQIGSAGTTSNSQQQIWHRMNTSLIGDTVQFGFTLNETQMFDPNLYFQTAEIEFHGAILDLSPSSLLA